MAYIYRDPHTNFYVDTPIIGIGGTTNIIFISNSEDPKYNGMYVLENPYGQPMDQKWKNTANSIYISRVSDIGNRGGWYAAVYGIKDPSYDALVNANPSDGYYVILRMPYIALSGISSEPQNWYWTKFRGLWPAICSDPDEQDVYYSWRAFKWRRDCGRNTIKQRF